MTFPACQRKDCTVSTWHIHRSEVGQWIKCPRQWWYERIEGVRDPDSPEAYQGTTLHKVQEFYLRAKMHATDIPFLDDCLAKYEAAFNKERSKVAWEHGKKAGVFLDQGLALTRLWYAEIAPTIDPAYVEHEVRVPLGDGLPDLLCIIDVIDKGGTIRDLKVASNYRANNMDPANSLQLMIYAYAAYDSLHWNAPTDMYCASVPVQYDVLNKGTQRVKAKALQPSTTFKLKQLEWASELVRNIAWEIAHSVAGGSPSAHFRVGDPAGWWCDPDYCAAYALCRGE